MTDPTDRKFADDIEATLRRMHEAEARANDVLYRPRNDDGSYGPIVSRPYVPVEDDPTVPTEHRVPTLSDANVDAEIRANYQPQPRVWPRVVGLIVCIVLIILIVWFTLDGSTAGYDYPTGGEF